MGVVSQAGEQLLVSRLFPFWLNVEKLIIFFSVGSTPEGDLFLLLQEYHLQQEYHHQQ
jgi:hypothetical protein